MITGVKFIVIADHRQPKVEDLLRRIYELYSDYVLKNPFYSLDMPIRYTCSPLYIASFNVIHSHAAFFKLCE